MLTGCSWPAAEISQNAAKAAALHSEAAGQLFRDIIAVSDPLPPVGNLEAFDARNGISSTEQSVEETQMDPQQGPQRSRSSSEV